MFAHHRSVRRVLDRCRGIVRSASGEPGSAAVEALQRQNYQRLVLLLADPDSGQGSAHHAARVDDLAIATLLICQPLRRPLAFAVERCDT